MRGAVVKLRLLAGAAGYQDDVGVRQLADRGVGGDREHAGVGGHRAGPLGREDHLRVIKSAQHLVGPDRVERREPVVEQDRYLHGASYRSAAAPRSGRRGSWWPNLPGGWKRCRYPAGETPSARMKARRIASGVP